MLRSITEGVIDIMHSQKFYIPHNRQSSSGLMYDDQTSDPKREEKIILHKKLLSLIENELEFSVRATNCLRQRNIKLVGDLIQTNKDDLLTIKGLGKKTVDEINDELEAIIKKIYQLFPKYVEKEDGQIKLLFSPWSKTRHLDSEFLTIMRNQEGEAGFILNGDTIELIGLQYDQLNNLVKRLIVKDKIDKEKLLSTAIIIKFLEKQFSSTRRYYFQTVIKPHRDWLELIERKFTPMIDGDPLEKWIRDRILLVR